MNAKSRLKFLIFLVGIAILIPTAALSVTLLAQFVAYFQQGADPASIFHGHALVIPAAESARWTSTDLREGKSPSQAEQEEVIAAYWQAWEALGRAHQTGDQTDLTTYWAGAAYDQALIGIDPQQRRTQTHSGHQLRLRFFSADGSVVAFDDEQFTLEQTPPGKDGVPLTLTASATVVMTLDQGFWRIRQISLNYSNQGF